MSCHLFRWCGTDLMRREMKWVSSRWNHVYTITNTWWVLELNRMRAYEIANMKQCIVGVSFIHGFICILVMWHSWKQQNETTIGISLRTTHSRDRGQIELAAAQLDPYHYDSFFLKNSIITTLNVMKDPTTKSKSGQWHYSLFETCHWYTYTACILRNPDNIALISSKKKQWWPD